jgi:hypothetical protein
MHLTLCRPDQTPNVDGVLHCFDAALTLLCCSSRYLSLSLVFRTSTSSLISLDSQTPPDMVNLMIIRSPGLAPDTGCTFDIRRSSSVYRIMHVDRASVIREVSDCMRHEDLTFLSMAIANDLSQTRAVIYTAT